MIRTGDTIHNPVTGERITFLATSADTDGEAVVIETVVQPKVASQRRTCTRPRPSASRSCRGGSA